MQRPNHEIAADRRCCKASSSPYAGLGLARSTPARFVAGGCGGSGFPMACGPSRACFSVPVLGAVRAAPFSAPRGGGRILCVAVLHGRASAPTDANSVSQDSPPSRSSADVPGCSLCLRWPACRPCRSRSAVAGLPAVFRGGRAAPSRSSPPPVRVGGTVEGTPRNEGASVRAPGRVVRGLKPVKEWLIPLS